MADRPLRERITSRSLVACSVSLLVLCAVLAVAHVGFVLAGTMRLDGVFLGAMLLGILVNAFCLASARKGRDPYGLFPPPDRPEDG